MRTITVKKQLGVINVDVTVEIEAITPATTGVRPDECCPAEGGQVQVVSIKLKDGSEILDIIRERLVDGLEEEIGQEVAAGEYDD